MQGTQIAIPLLLVAASGLLAQKANPWLLPNFSDRVEFVVSNPSDHAFHGVVVLPIAKIAKAAPGFPGSLALVTLRSDEVRALPSQADDLDGDGQPDEFAFSADLKPHESITLDIYYSRTLHDTLPWPEKTFASHAFGYNKATAALESEKIGYRMYGGFFLDVQARRAGDPGLYNSLVGYLSAGLSRDSTFGRDVFHIGDTLGLGGLFLRFGTSVFRPPMNVPDYLHRPPAAESPTYRVIATGPVRAVVEASLPHWNLGTDAVSLKAIYSIDANSEVVRCRFFLTPLSLKHTYEVGVGVRHLPKMKQASTSDFLAVEGEQSIDIGQIGLALYFDPRVIDHTDVLQTPEDINDVAIFRKRLAPGTEVSGSYSVAAAWSGSGIKDLLGHLRQLESATTTQPLVSGFVHSITPAPQRLTGEAY